MVCLEAAAILQKQDISPYLFLLLASRGTILGMIFRHGVLPDKISILSVGAASTVRSDQYSHTRNLESAPCKRIAYM